RVVRSVGEPEADDRGTKLSRDLDAVEALVECAPPNGGVGVGQASKTKGVVTEKVRVDRTDPDAPTACVVTERAPVVNGIPWDMQSHARAAAGQLVDECCVVDPLPNGAGCAWPRIDVDARTRVSVPPRRGLDLESIEAGEHGV